MTGQNSAPRDAPIRMVMMPRDTNPHGSIFGGHIMSLIDLAAGRQARKEAPHRYVTKKVSEVIFHAPVYVGDEVSFYTETVRVGTTSVTVRIEVEALRGIDELTLHRVTEAEVVMVAVDENGNPIPVHAPTP